MKIVPVSSVLTSVFRDGKVLDDASCLRRLYNDACVVNTLTEALAQYRVYVSVGYPWQVSGSKPRNLALTNIDNGLYVTGNCSRCLSESLSKSKSVFFTRLLSTRLSVDCSVLKF